MAHATRAAAWVAMSDGFITVFGRNLLAELPSFVHRPYLVVTMEDLWPLFAETLEGSDLAGVHRVASSSSTSSKASSTTCLRPAR